MHSYIIHQVTGPVCNPHNFDLCLNSQMPNVTTAEISGFLGGPNLDPHFPYVTDISVNSKSNLMQCRKKKLVKQL